MARTVTAKKLLTKHVARADRVLLVNPPVEETRYSWLRWNQPLDLLTLGAYLKDKVGCSVELFDCMKPNKDGDVPEEWLPRDRRYYTVQGERYPMRRYGLSCNGLVDLVHQWKARNPGSLPTQVWITSLCSYWYETVAEMCRVVRQALPDTQIVLIGQYPRLMPDHADTACAADYLVTSAHDLTGTPHTLELYGKDKPPFVAVQLHKKTAAVAVKAAVADGVYNVTLYEDDICRDGGGLLTELVSETRDLHKHLRYHLICGMDPAKFTPALAKLIAEKTFAAVHFEEADRGDQVDMEVYKRVRGYLTDAGVKHNDDRFSGFVWIGRPGDQLEQLVLRTFQVLESLGSLILKPYTPTPGSPDHMANKKLLDSLSHREWSPHFFPFAELNGITRQEYHDLYRMAAFLNEKVRAQAFNFLSGTLGAKLLRESLRKEVWKLEPSPFRVID